MPATAAATARTTAPSRRAPAKRAPARRAPARRPPARRAAPRRAAATRRAPARRRPTRRRALGLVPVAVGRIPGAVSGLADSGLFLRLTRGRLWIGLLACLLVGIVAVNVLALSFSASSSRSAAAADQLERENSAERARIARSLSNGEVQSAASRLGLAIPGPDSIGYLKASPDNAAVAAKRLRNGELTVGAPVEVVAVAPATDVTTAPLTDPTAAATTAPPATTTTTTVPTATTAAPPATTEPTATAAAPAGAVTP
jgi:hypothetical protein